MRANNRDGDIVRVLCIVTGKKTRILKRRGYMAFITLEDTSGSIEMLVFPPLYDQYRELLEENQVLYIEARLSIREEDTKLVCRAVATPQEVLDQPEGFIAIPPHHKRKDDKPQVRRKRGKRPGLYLRVPSRESREFLKSEQYLDIFEGEVPVYYFFLDTKKLGLRAAEAVDHLQQPAVLPVGEDFREGECGGGCSREGAE